jgi:hypothetical protein
MRAAQNAIFLEQVNSGQEPLIPKKAGAAILAGVTCFDFVLIGSGPVRMAPRCLF